MRRFFRDEIVRDITVMFLSGNMTGVFNLLFQLYMVRSLTTVDYGVFNSLLTLLIILPIPISAIQTAIIKFVAAFSAHEQWGKIRNLFYCLTQRIILIAACIFLLMFIARQHIAHILQISNYNLITMAAVAVSFSVIMPLATGGIQGLQRFGYLGSSNVVGGVTKLILGVIFIKLSFGVMGAMNALVISTLISLLLLTAPLMYFLKKSKHAYLDEAVNFSEIYKYFCPVAITLFCVYVLTWIDVILVKAFFDPETAGLYSTAQIVGKIIYFLPGPVAIVMFPKTSASYAQSKDTVSILKKSLVILMLVCGGASLGCVLFPSVVMKLLVGKAYPEAIPFVRLFAITMIPFAVINLIVQYKLSVHNLRFIPLLVFFTILQVVLIIFFHNSLYNVLYIMLGNSIALLITLLISLKR